MPGKAHLPGSFAAERWVSAEPHLLLPYAGSGARAPMHAATPVRHRSTSAPLTITAPRAAARRGCSHYDAIQTRGVAPATMRRFARGWLLAAPTFELHFLGNKIGVCRIALFWERSPLAYAGDAFTLLARAPGDE